MNYKQEISSYLEYCEYRKELDANTLKAYRIDLQQFMSFIGDLQPNRLLLETYVTELHKKYKQKTVKRKIASIKAFFGYLEEQELLSDNPMRHVRTKFKEEQILPRIISRDDIEKLLNGMYQVWNKEKNPVLIRDIAVVETFFATGARVYEISNIRRENIELLTGTICFMGKGGKERRIQIGDQNVVCLLKLYYANWKTVIDGSGYFFVNRRGERLTEQSIRLLLKKYANQMELSTKVTPHMFRHSVATYLIEEGVDISCVQQLLGHSSIKTTQIYIHVAAKRQADILREFHPRNKMNIKSGNMGMDEIVS